MTDAAAEARRAYRRKWQRENRDKVKAAQERYWERQAAKAAAENAEKPTDSDTQRTV